MKRITLGLLLGLGILSLAPAADEAPFPEGNWKVGYFQGGFANEVPAAIVKLSKKDGKLTGEVLAVSPTGFPPLPDNSVTFTGKTMLVKLSGPQLTLTFESALPEKAAKVVYGNFGNDRTRLPAIMTPTTKETFEKDEAPAKMDQPAPYTEATKLAGAANIARMTMAREKDADKKAELKTKYEAAKKTSDDKLPGLYREVVAKHADTLAAYDAALVMIRNIEAYKLTTEEATAAVGIVESTAAKFGAPIVATVMPGVIESLSKSKNPKIGEIALTFAQKAYAGLKISDPAETQSKVLTTLKNAQQAAGKVDEAKATSAKLAVIEKKVDEEYEKKVPPFAPGKYAGRKDGGNRIAVMELFTGAQCPPCVAADVGFDGLGKAYTPNDLVLIQYHMHIPGPDPLTNADSVRRWDYYNKLPGIKLGGTPSTLFNGKMAAGGGGGMANSKGKFDSYKKVIDEILDEKTEVKVTGKASMKDDLISAEAEVTGVKEVDDVKVRFILVEGTVKYVGGNGLRFHHQVMRGFVGSADGYAIKAATPIKAEVKLGAVRDTLTKYIEDYDANQSPFPYPERGLTLKGLKVIALVQNDKTGEILGAYQIDAEGAK